MLRATTTRVHAWPVNAVGLGCLVGCAWLAVGSPAIGQTTDPPWHHPLHLDNHGYWPVRLPIRLINEGRTPCAGLPVRVSLKPLAGLPAASMRVCDEHGQELLFDLLDHRQQPKTSGTIEMEDMMVLPADCAPGQSRALFIYGGNQAALPPRDFWNAASQMKREGFSTAIPGLRVFLQPVQRLGLTPHAGPSLTSREEWPVSAVVRIFNFAPEPVGPAVVVADLRPSVGRWLKVGLDSARCVVNPQTDETGQSCVRMGQELLFLATLPARSSYEISLGINPRRKESRASWLEGYAALLHNPSNLAPGNGAENTTELLRKWIFQGPSGPCDAGVTNDAVLGKVALHFAVPASLAGQWIGWRSDHLRVRAGGHYYLGGFLKGTGLSREATIHAHWHNAAGALVTNHAYVSTRPAISGTTDWTPTGALLVAPPDAASLRIHLTMNGAGRLQHDGLLFAEVLRGQIVRLETEASLPARPTLCVYEVNPLIKVFPEDPPAPGISSARLQLAQNEFEPLQLVARTTLPTRRLSVSASALTNQEGVALPSLRIERVGYVPVDHPSGYYRADGPEWFRKLPSGPGATDGWAGEWPDPLLRETSTALAGGRNQPYWITARALSNTPPGEYRGELRFSTQEGESVRVFLSVEVLPFALPSRTTLKAIFDLRRGPGGWLGMDPADPATRRRWLSFLAEHRLGIDAILPEPVFGRTNGVVTLDTTAFDEAARFCFDELGMNASYTPRFFYMFGWAYPPRELFGLKPFTPDWNDALQQAVRAFSKHIASRGWGDRFVYYISDEPHFDRPFVADQMVRLCALIHEAAPGMRIYSSTWRHCPAWDSSLNIWGIGQHGSFPPETMEAVRRKGGRFWFTCDGQMATDTPYLATERLLPYYCHKYGVDGFEFWGVSWWTHPPHTTGWHAFIRQSDDGSAHYWIRYPNGDGYLTYPGPPGSTNGPLSSIRLEQVREGLEDFEAMTMLARHVEISRRGSRSTEAGQNVLRAAEDLVRIPNAGGLRSTEILPDPDRIPQIRRDIYRAIVDLHPGASLKD